MSRLFGTDGVRGEANKALTPEMAYRLGRAATLYFGKGTKQPLILIGREVLGDDRGDTGAMLAALLERFPVSCPSGLGRSG